MASTIHKAYGTIATPLSTGLNALATATNSAVSSAIDNSTNLDLYMDLELHLATMAVARTAGQAVLVYMTPSIDGGTTYTDALESISELVAVFTLDAAVTARTAVVRDVPMPPGLFKLFARNVSGQTLAATLNTVRYRPHSISTA